MLMISSELALSRWSEDPNPFTATLSVLTIVAGGLVTLFGFLDRYVLRRQIAEIRSRRVQRLTQAFIAGFILLPTTAIFSCSPENPNNSGRSTSPARAAVIPARSVTPRVETGQFHG
jgi:hypothetical protein